MRNLWLIGMIGWLALWLASSLVAQPFTYQGFLRQSGTPANGTFDFRFRLFTAPTGGTQVGSDQLVDDHSVQNGLFTVSLNFGNVWDGNDRYLEISVRPGDSTGEYQVLTPRVRVSPTPYAMYALKPWEPNGSAIFYNGGNVGIGTNSPAARLSLGGGNANTKLALWQGNTASEMMGFGVGAGQFRLHLNNYWDRFSFLNAPNGSELVTIQGDGNVGIGTIYPRALLSLGSSFADTKLALWQGDQWGQIMGLGVGEGQFRLHLHNSGNRFSFLNAPNGNELVTIKGDGNVGIGTNSPAARLSLGGGNADTKLALWQGNTTGQIMGLGVGAGQFRLHLNHSGDRFSFLNAPNGNELVTIKGDGNVGIGTSSPSEQLHVVATTAQRAIYGHHPATTGETYGVFGRSESTEGRAVAGWASSNSGVTYGVFGVSDSRDGRGVVGWATANPGTNYGVFGVSDSIFGTGVYGWATATTHYGIGVYGESASAYGKGVSGIASSTNEYTIPYGVYGRCDARYGYGVYSHGRMSGTYKMFQIDHPLMPETHYLNHFCTEGSEPYNIYRGTVMLDARGEAWVQLPDYFHAINRDPSYHLTAVGAPMPNLHVAVEIQANRFKIAGGVPGKKVSWEVKAVRNDRWVQQYGFQAEQPKPDAHKGKYLHPELFGQPKEKGIHYRPEPERPAEPMRPEVEPTREEARPN